MGAGNEILLRLRTAGARKTAGEIGEVTDATLDVRDAQIRTQKAADQLTDQIDKQERAAEDVARALDRYGRQSDEARTAQVRLERAQRDTAAAAVRLERAQRDVSTALDRQDQSAGGASDMLTGLGKKAGAAALAIAGVDTAMSAVNATLDRGVGEDNAAAALGLSPRAQRRAGRAAADAYADGYGDSIDQVYAAVVSVGQDISDVETMRPGVLGRLIRRSLNLSAVFGDEVNEVNRVVGDQLRNGMVRSSEEAFDLITIGYQRGANRSQELLDTLREYAEPVASLGLDMRDFMNILVTGADNGVYSSDRLGDALKELSIRAVDEVDTTKNAYRALGLDADQTAAAFANGGPAAKRALGTVVGALFRVNDEVRQNRIGVNLFGTMWEDVGPRAIRSLDPTRNALGRVGGAARRLDRTVSDGPKQTMDRFFRDLENDAVNVIGGTVIPFIEDDLPVAFETMSSVVEGAFGGITDGLEGVVNGAVQVVNELIGAYNLLPDPLQVATGGDQITPLSFVGAHGERLMQQADSYLPDTTDDNARQILRRVRRQRQRDANPLFAAPVATNLPMRAGPPASAGSRGSRNLTVPVTINGREVGRAVQRFEDDDAQWGRGG